MLLPSIFGENLLDNWLDFSDVDRKLYGRNASHVMKTDVHENEQGYEVDIDLPGFKKEEIDLSLENGYLSVSAAKNLENEKKNLRGKVIRQERYSGSMQRSFYVGDEIEESDIKAKFEDGVLKLAIPKKEAAKIPEKKTIAIEG
ncbi:MAG: Hsp20/alpha crystallin family protein [Lachnospiraceae bacterium]|nr:Hsp20/alpha crystallin family protein [Lachnospiraceae bacterium]